MTEVIMPKMGDGMEEGTLLEWTKKDGDTVKSGEIIGSIQTDKATLELEAPATGSLAGILISAGAIVPVGKPMAAILKAGETLPSDWGSADRAQPAPEPVGAMASTTTSVSSPVADPAPVASAPAAPATPSRVVASPLAKKVARERGIDLAALHGSGPGGRIIEKDVLSATSAPAVTSAPAPVAITATASDQIIPITRLRQITAQRTLQSKTQVPHYYVTVEVDVERIMNLRETFEEEAAGKISLNDFIIRAVCLSCREVPTVNSTFQGDKVLQFGAVNVGIAAAVADGLTVAVLHHADQMSLRQISERAKDLVVRARDNKLSLDELSGSTISISNMGMLNVDNFAAIINQPNAAIVAVSSVRKTVTVNDEDEVEIRRRMNLTGSFDHRVVDGAVGAKFMNAVRDYLQNPTRLLS